MSTATYDQLETTKKQGFISKLFNTLHNAWDGFTNHLDNVGASIIQENEQDRQKEIIRRAEIWALEGQGNDADYVQDLAKDLNKRASKKFGKIDAAEVLLKVQEIREQGSDYQCVWGGIEDKNGLGVQKSDLDNYSIEEIHRMNEMSTAELLRFQSQREKETAQSENNQAATLEA